MLTSGIGQSRSYEGMVFIQVGEEKRLKLTILCCFVSAGKDGQARV